MRKIFKTLLVLLLLTLSMSPYADEKEDLLVIRNTVVNLLQQLVEQGVMTTEQATELVETAKKSAESEVQELKKVQEVSGDTVRVQYVPEIVKQEIREQVRSELRAEVTKDVIKHAETNRWGVKDSLPGWINRIKVSGDIRLRAVTELYDEDNSLLYPDAIDTNDDGSSIQNLNIIDDRERSQIRMRLAVNAKVNNSVNAGIRISTGNTRNPVSTNQTLGNTGNRYDTVIDRAYLKYTDVNNDGYEWLDLWGGRIPNPWFNTDLIWDSDLSFEGISGTARYNFAGGDSLYDLTETNKEIFLTMGVFPLQEFRRTSNDPFLLGAQIGGSVEFQNQSSFKVAASYFYYDDIQGDLAPVGVNPNDINEPEFFQYGNSLFDISDQNDLNTFLFGYASDFEILGLTAQLGLSTFAPYRLTLTGEYVENIGYENSSVQRRLNDPDYQKETTGYQMRVDFGWPSAKIAGNWKIYAAYKHLERDAVFGAFTDSDFHGGGTDAEGFILGADYGLFKNTWLSFRWISTDEITGPEFRPGIDCDIDNCRYSYDRAQVDINAKF